MKNKTKSIIKNIILLSVIVISSILIYSFAESQTYDEYQLFRDDANGRMAGIHSGNEAINVCGINIKKPIKVGTTTEHSVGDTIKKVCSASFYKDCIMLDISGKQYKYEWNDAAYGISYLAGKTDVSTYKVPDSSGNTYVEKMSPIQYAVLRYGTSFINSKLYGVGTKQEFSIGSNLNISAKDDANVTGSVTPASDGQIGQEIIQKIKSWKEMIQSDGEISLNADGTYNIEPEYTIGDKKYIKAGPIVMKCTGEIKDFKVTTQSGEKLNEQVYKYKGENLEKTEISDAEIKAGTKFYILIDTSDATNKRLLGSGENNLKLSVKTNGGNLLKNSDEANAQNSAPKISIWRNNTPGHQDMISLDAGLKDWNGESEATLNLSVKYERMITVAAYEAKKGSSGKYEPTNMLLDGAKFVIRKKGTKEYVKVPTGDNGYNQQYKAWVVDSFKTITGDPKEDEEVVFKCENGEFINIIGLAEGEYEIEQVEIPEGYEEITDDPDISLKISFKIPFEGEDTGWYRTFNKKIEDNSIKIYKYEAMADNPREPNKDKGILDGATFVIRNSQGKYVRNPGADVGGIVDLESYDEETQTYMIEENDYLPKEMFDEENWSYSPLVQFKIQEGKPITIKGLKEGKYEIEEIEPPSGYRLSSLKMTFDLPDAWGHEFNFVDEPTEGGEYKARISKRGLQEIYSYTETVDGWWNWGSEGALAQTPPGRGTPWGSGERIFRLVQIDPSLINQVASEIQKSTLNWAYNASRGITHYWDPGKGSTCCAEGADWVYHEVLKRATEAHLIDPNSYTGSAWCLGGGTFKASDQLRNMSALAQTRPDIVVEVGRENARPGDFVLNWGHSQIVRGNIQETKIEDTSKLLGGGKFVLRNKTTNEFVRRPKKAIEAEKNDMGVTGPENAYDAETCTYYISESDYLPSELVYNEKSRKYKSIVIFESVEDKMLNFEGLKAGEYEIIEVDSPPGYTVSEEYVKYTTLPDKNDEEVQFINRSGPNGSFRKVIEGTEVGLVDFEFQLILHPIVEEYKDDINPAIFPNTYQGPESDHAFKLCSDTDGYNAETGKCMHGKDPSHINEFANEKVKYNKAVQEANKWHARRKQFVDEINTRGIVTDEDGYADLKPLTIIRDDDKGWIDIKETSVGGNPYFNLKNDDGSDRIMRLEYHKDNVMENERKRFDIEGLIWEDEGHKKKAEYDALYNEGLENLVHPIEVRMKKKGVKEEKGTGVITDDGHYRVRFGGDNGEYLKEFLNDKTGWYIEFTYNGIVFQNVEVNLGDDNGSKAAEVPEDRISMHKNYKTVTAGSTGNSSVAGEGLDKKSVEYWRPPDQNLEGQENVSKTRYEGEISGELQHNEKESEPVGDGRYNVRKVPKREYNQEYENPNDTTNADNCYYINSKETLGKYQITATTEQAGYEGFEPYDVTIDRIENVNLGLYRREQPDLSIVNDIYQVRVEYDGHRYTYQYGKKTAEDIRPGDITYQGDIPNYQGGAFDVTVKFTEKRNPTYQRQVYPSDVEIVPAEDALNNSLKIYVTYKTVIFNESTTLSVRPTELVSHYDEEYQDIVDVTERLGNPENKVTEWKDDGYGKEQKTAEGYKKAYGTIEKIIPPEEMIEVFTEYRLNRKQCLGLLNGNSDAKLEFYNHFEINAYTTYKDGEEYGGIDKDSHPGNMIPGDKDKTTYEDDNDEAPEFSLVLTKNNRFIEGNVFEDIPDLPDILTEDGRTVTERKGNGENNGENAIQDVMVELWEIEKDGGTGEITEKRVTKLDMPKVPVDEKNSDPSKWVDKYDDGKLNEFETNLQSGKGVNEEGEEEETIMLAERDNLEDARVKTDENGHYRFYGFSPGQYLIKYIWGQNEVKKIINQDGVETSEVTPLKTKINKKDTNGNINPEYITVQQYKSTIFNNQQRYENYTQLQAHYDKDGNETLKPSRWYLHATNPYIDSSTRKYEKRGPDEFDHTNKSNAIDEMITDGKRQKIDDKMKDINNTNNYNNFVDKNYNSTAVEAVIDSTGWDSDWKGTYGDEFDAYKTDYENYQTMLSRTATFDIGVENLLEDDDGLEKYMDGNEDIRDFEIRGVDFGISERPNMDLRLRKEITNIRLVLPNGQILIDANIDYEEDDSAGTGFTSNATGSIENTKYLQPRVVGNTLRDIGKFHAEMDTELIHGSTLQITYRYTISNKSELDYELQSEDKMEGITNKNVYYKFGITQKDIENGAYGEPMDEVTINATKVVDYMDNKLNYDETLEDDPNNHPYGSSNQQWLRDAIEISEIEDVPDDGVDVEKGLFNKGEVFHDKESINGYAISTPDQMIDLSTTQEKVEEIKKKYTTLTRGEQDGSSREGDNGGPLLANKESEFYLTATKGLGNTTQEMSYQNFAEIIKIKKTGGEYPGGNQDNDIYPETSIGKSESEDYVDSVKGYGPGLTPGNGCPTMHIPDELDGGNAQQVTITPPTGDNSKYITAAWTIVGIISLGALGAGIIAIKKAGRTERKLR